MNEDLNFDGYAIASGRGSCRAGCEDLNLMRLWLNINVKNDEWLPFRRFKELIVSTKYPIVLAWGKTPLTDSWNKNHLCYHIDVDDYTVCWVIPQEHIEDWEYVYHNTYSEDELCFEEYYKYYEQLINL